MQFKAHTAQFFAVEELATKASISKVTAQNYMEALKALYVFDSLPAWSKGDYDMIGKREKWIATDSALVANLLGWGENEVYMDEGRNGKLVETWVYQHGHSRSRRRILHIALQRQPKTRD